MRSGRAIVYVLLFLLVTINYIDRVALSVAARPIAVAFDISTVQMGYLFSSFLWTYLVSLIPMGILVDRIGSRAVSAAGMAVWSLATMATAFSFSFASLLATRLVMGAGEATTYPAGGRIIREWAPRGERGVATTIFNAGGYAGPAIGSLLVGWLASWLGWRGAFFVAGGIGFIWLAAWLALFRRPEEARFIGAEERARIIAERDAATADLAATPSSGLLLLLRSRTMWGLALTQGCAVYTQYLLLTWLPSYLQTTRNLSILKTGIYTALPYFGAVVLSILAARLSDRLLRRSGGVHTGERRTMVVVSLLAAAIILAVPLAGSTWLILALLTLSLTGVASAVSLNIALTNDLLTQPGDAGKAMGILVSGGNAFGLMAPIVTGYVIAATTTYSAAFLIAGFFLVAGATISLTLTRRPIRTA